MFAVNHAATALLLKRAFPRTHLALLLGSVQLVEFAWVGLNLVGIERTVTDPVVRSVGDIHLAHMPWSHSVATTAVAAVVAAVAVRWLTDRWRAGLAVGLGVLSHLLLDLATHAPDIALAPIPGAPKLGLGLYGAAPLVAFAVELGWGVWCWKVYRGGKALLATIVGFNLANLTLFLPGVVGVEGVLAGHPTALVLVIAMQIVVTITLIGWLAGRESEEHEARIGAWA